MSSKSFFDQVASQWEIMRTSFYSKEVREKAYAVAAVRAGQVAADIGAGSGFMTEGLVQQGLKVIAIDQSQAMLDELGKRFEGVDRRLSTGDHLPIDDVMVDHAFANMYLHHVEDPSTAIKEMARIVKPGGKVVITDLDEHAHEFLRTEHHDRWMGFKRADLMKWFAGAGLKDVDVESVGTDCTAESSDGNTSAVVNIFVASGEK